ncbi:MAG: hypothetical protein HYR85_15870, partial [Planctomycetes bacterium]|nr:hypothetical protein [Planctomycetota bacterium]
ERARAAVAPRVHELFAELGDADAVFARIDGDASFTSEERRVALREALRQCLQ